MGTNPLSVDELLAQQGWIRALAHRLVAESSEADDSVQDVFLAALEHPPASGKPLGPWLVRVLRNRVLKGGRSEVRRRERERRMSEDLPRPDELVDRVELQQELVRAVLSLDEPDRSALLLHYFEELPAVEIARRQGLAPAAVRQRLKRARERLREALDRRNGGDRDAWSLALLAWATPETAPASAPPDSTVFEDSSSLRRHAMKTALSLVGATAVVSGLVFLVRDSNEEVDPLEFVLSTPAPPPPAFQETGGSASDARRSIAGSPDRPREEPPASGLPSTGTLEVVVVRADGSPGEEEWVLIETDAPRHPFAEEIRVRTDGLGRATLELQADSVGAGLLRRGDSLDWVELGAGETQRIELELPVGYTIEGRLVDSEGRPIAGGSLWVSEPWSRRHGHVLARSDSQGHYRLAGLQPDGMHWFFAFAPDHAPSGAGYLDAAPGSVVQHDIVLDRSGGAVDGRVLAPDGNPLAGAQVLVGFDHAHWDGPRPRRTKTDIEGSFTIEGLKPGPMPLMARATGYSAVQQELTVLASGRQGVTLRLGPEARITGRVLDLDGEPLAKARVGVEGVPRFVAATTLTDDAGRYVLSGLSAGRARLVARHEETRAEIELLLSSDADSEWSPRLQPIPTVAGVLLDAFGDPVGKRELSLREDNEFGRGVEYTFTDDRGNFSFGTRRDVDHLLLVQAPALDLPDGRLGRAPDVVRRHGVRPSLEPLVVVLEDEEAGQGTLRGRVLGPGGQPPASAFLIIHDLERDAGSTLTLDPEGRFDLRLQAATLRLSIEAEGSARLDLGSWTLTAGETLELGTRILPTSGFVTVVFSGARLPEDLRVTWTSADGTRLGRGQRTGVAFRSPPLAAGARFLSVQGRGIVSRTVEVKVQASEQKRLEVQLAPALVRQVELGFPAGDPRPGEFRAVARDALGRERWSGAGFFEPIGALRFAVSLPEGVFEIEVRVDTGRAAAGVLEPGTQTIPMLLELR